MQISPCKNQGVIRDVLLSGGIWGKSIPFPFLASRGCSHCLAHGPLTPSSKPKKNQVESFLSITVTSSSFKYPCDCVCVCEGVGVCVCAHTQSLSRVWLFATPWTVAHSPVFPRQEYGSGLPFPPPGDLPNPQIEPGSSALAGRFFTTAPSGKPSCDCTDPIQVIS